MVSWCPASDLGGRSAWRWFLFCVVYPQYASSWPSSWDVKTTQLLNGTTPSLLVYPSIEYRDILVNWNHIKFVSLKNDLKGFLPSLKLPKLNFILRFIKFMKVYLTIVACLNLYKIISRINLSCIFTIISLIWSFLYLYLALLAPWIPHKAPVTATSRTFWLSVPRADPPSTHLVMRAVQMSQTT